MRGKNRLVRKRATIRKVSPWSVLKLSLIFYFCGLLVVMIGLTVLWAVIHRLGLIEQLTAIAATFQFDVRFYGDNIARAVFLIGLLNVVLLTGVNVFMAFLYNLVADVLGGFDLDIAIED